MSYCDIICVFNYAPGVFSRKDSKSGMFFDADGKIFDRKISPGVFSRRLSKIRPGGAYFRENPVPVEGFLLFMFICRKGMRREE